MCFSMFGAMLTQRLWLFEMFSHLKPTFNLIINNWIILVALDHVIIQYDNKAITLDILNCECKKPM